jgi:hypothetical protein
MLVLCEVSGVVAILARISFKSTYAIQANIAASSSNAWDLMSIVREGFSPVDDPNKVDKKFHKNEIKPFGEIFLALNDFAGFEVLKMKEYEMLETAQIASLIGA